MPNRYYDGSPKLDIQLEMGGRKWFMPGETISGNVVRMKSIVAPVSIVSIRLFGRTKAKIVRGSGRTRRVYRSGFELFSAVQPQVHLQIYNGPVHVAEDGAPQAFPFAVTIPTTCCISAQSAEAREFQDKTLLPIADSMTQPIPPTYNSDASNSQHQTLVEYYLEATIRYGVHDSLKEHKTLFPVTIKTPALHFTQFPETQRLSPQTVRSYHLVPGLENAKLSFKQKTHQFLDNDKVPLFTFKIQTTVPQQIQLENPNISIRLLAIPDPAASSPVLKDATPTLTIEYVSATVVSIMTATCLRSWSDDQDVHSQRISLGLDRAFWEEARREPLLIPYGPTDAPIDIGQHLQLKLTAKGLYSGRKLLAPIYGSLGPDMTTYNVQQSHHIEWKIVYKVAGIQQKIDLKTITEIVAATEDVFPVGEPVPAAAAGPSAAAVPAPVYSEDAILPAYAEGTAASPTDKKDATPKNDDPIPSTAAAS